MTRSFKLYRAFLRRRRLTGQPALPSPELVLVLPDDLAEPHIGWMMAETFRRVRDELAGQEYRWRELARGEDDHGRLAALTARADAYAHATARMDRALVDAFALGDQYSHWARRR
jgi:hypothetical protein